MKGYSPSCPGKIKPYDISHICAYQGYEILETGIFTEDSGFDPLAMKVKCRACGYIYILFPLAKAIIEAHKDEK